MEEACGRWSCLFVKFEKVQNVLVVYLTGELDHHSAEEVRVKIDDEIDRNRIDKVVLDFSEVSFMDSSGIGVVVGRLRKLSSRDGNMCIAELNNRIYKVFELSGLFKVIKSYNSLREALNNV